MVIEWQGFAAEREGASPLAKRLARGAFIRPPRVLLPDPRVALAEPVSLWLARAAASARGRCRARRLRAIASPFRRQSRAGDGRARRAGIRGRAVQNRRSADARRAATRAPPRGWRPTRCTIGACCRPASRTPTCSAGRAAGTSSATTRLPGRRSMPGNWPHHCVRRRPRCGGQRHTLATEAGLQSPDPACC
jgi:hypothetical protein